MAKIVFTAGRVAAFKCPADKPQAFLWDSTTTGLGLRITPAGKPSYVFQGLFGGKTLRVTIGSPDAWRIPQAQQKARELQRLIDEGRDPRDLKRDAVAAVAKKRSNDAAHAVTVGEAWLVYMAARQPRWGERTYKDHEALTKAGGLPATRGTRGLGKTIPGPLHPLLALPLHGLDSPAIEAWAAREAKTRATQARLAWRCLKAFLNWCAEQPEYAAVLPAVNAAKTKKAREALGKAGVKQDALLKEQLKVWFDAVKKIENKVTAAYLQTLLLVGCRPGEILGLRWDEINTQWRGLTIRDKVEGTRVIPLTPYVAQLLAALPRRNAFVFSSATAADGVLTIPRNAHGAACVVAGLEGLTLHGLRRSFKSLTEWLEIPAGVVAQLMGHRPSATAEKHYTVRPLDLLRLHHEKIEAWVLEQAGIVFDAKAAPSKLHAVATVA
jgi:integrase